MYCVLYVHVPCILYACIRFCMRVLGFVCMCGFVCVYSVLCACIRFCMRVLAFVRVYSVLYACLHLWATVDNTSCIV